MWEQPQCAGLTNCLWTAPVRCDISQLDTSPDGSAFIVPNLARPNHSAEQERIAYLEKKIQTKDEVLAELMAEHVALKTVTRVWVTVLMTGEWGPF